MHGAIRLAVFGLAFLSLGLIAQEKPTQKVESKVPSFGLEISDEEPIAAQFANQAYDQGFVCTSDGSIAVNILLPPDKAKPRSVWVLYAVSQSGKIVSFDFSKVNDLAFSNGQRAMAHDVGERDVNFLFSARPMKGADSQTQDRPVLPPGWFVARFDRDGMYHGATELNLPRLVPQRMAAFDNGDLLIFALDEANRQPQLVRYSMTGGKIHYYFADAEFARQNPNVPSAASMGNNPDRSRVELSQLLTSMQVSQFSHYKDSILLLQKGGETPLFRAFPDGDIRTIQLPKVPGFDKDVLISSDEHVYLQYRKPRADGNGEDRILILELDADTGKELRRIAPGDLEVACVHQGHFRVIRHEGGHTFRFFNASVRASQ